MDKRADRGLQDSGNTEENLEQVYLDRSGVAQISFEEYHRIFGRKQDSRDRNEFDIYKI